jgi:amino acid adenylation domain-containing protein
VGAVGELYLSGYQLSSGYLNNPEKNAEAFFDNPFSDEAGYEHMYATGDFFRLLPDGTLGIIGRRDGQVKVRGNRVELTEVEACIRSMPGISDVTVQAIAAEDGTKELCAYVVLDQSSPSESVSAESILSYVAERKPDYMVPAFVMTIDSIPLNVNGKVDRRALPKPDVSSLRKEYAAPRNDTERILCEAFSFALGIETIGIDDDFIRLGGDSLKAIKAVSVCRSSGTEVRVSDILSKRSPRTIASSLSSGMAECIYSLESGCPLTGGALDIYLDVESGRSDSVYIIDCSYLIPEGTSGDAAREALLSLLYIHPILRSRIVMKDGEPWFSVDAEPEITASDSPADDIRRPFVLSEELSRFHIISGKSIQAAFHHTVSDGLTVGIIGRTLQSIFAGHTPERDIGFLRDASLHSSSDTAAAEGFFRDMLSDVDGDLVPIPDPDGRFGMGSIRLSGSIDSISVAARSMGSTPANFLATAFGYALSRFTGSSTAVFSHIVNGRDLTSSEDSAGMFVRTLPVAIDCRDRPVSEFVSESSERILGTIENQLCPFHRIASDLGIGFGIVFNHLTGIEQHGDAVRGDMGEGDIIGDLTFNLIRSGDSYILSYSHSSKYSEATVGRMASAFDRIVSGLISCDRLTDIRYTSDDDISILDSINDTSAPLQYHDILEAFRHQVTQSPEAVLLTYLDRSYTYADVDRISDSIAAALSSRGVSPGDSIAIMVPRSEWYLLCAIGILKTGAAYMPIDTSYPDERVAFMFSDSSSKAVLVTDGTAARAISLASSISTPMEVMRCDRLPDSEFDPAPVSPGDTAVILYTSGTTGTPKGTLITRLAVENFSEWMSSRFSLSSEDVIGQHASFGFDAHLVSMFPPFIAGSSMDIISEDAHLDVDALSERIRKRGITCMFLSTQLGKMLLADHPDVPLRKLHLGGEALGDIEFDGSTEVIDGYGPTENTACSMAVSASQRSTPSSVGCPNSNVRAYILDTEHRRVPVGAVGELYLSGYQLSSGYLNNPEKNAEAFFDNPFSDEPGYERMYATGDFFRLLPDGTMGIIGRRDGQVKIRGNRVELTEVESCIRSMPGISDVTVQALVAENGAKELCAYIVPDATVSVGKSVEDIQSYVAARKPDYMVPAFVVTIDSIPLNVNGKVDRRALPKPDLSSLRKEYVAPRTDAERILCQVFSEALRIDRIGIDDDFVRLGGDSLKATKVASVFNTLSEYHILARDILRRRTVRDISSDMRVITTEGTEYSFESGHPPTMSQQDVIEYMAESGLSLNISAALSFGDMLDAQTLVPIIKALIATTPDLRMHVVKRDGAPHILYDADVEITVDACDPEEFGKGFVRQFTPYGPSLSRFAVIEYEGQCHLFVDICHLAFDGRSIAPLIGRIMMVLTGNMPPMDDGLLRQAAHDRGYMASQIYHDRVLGLFHLLEGSDDIYEDSEPSESDNGLELRQLALTSEGMARIMAALDTGPSDIFYCAFSYAMSRVYGKDKLFYIIEDGRGDVDVSESVGVFMRLHPIRIRKRTDDILDYVRDSVPQIDETMSYSDIPLTDVRKLRHMWPDVVIQFNNYLSGFQENLPEVSARPLMPLSRSPFRIHINVNPVGEGFVARITYSEMQSGEPVRRLMDEFDTFLSDLSERL